MKYATLITLCFLTSCSDKLPIMNCDPAALTSGMTKDQIIKLCGKPDDIHTQGVDWYPLDGQTRDNKHPHTNETLSYGNIWNDKHHVHLYLKDGQLEDAQIYGDYK